MKKDSSLTTNDAKLFEAERVDDLRFLDGIRDEYVIPLIDEIASVEKRFATWPITQRFFYIEKLAHTGTKAGERLGLYCQYLTDTNGAVCDHYEASQNIPLESGQVIGYGPGDHIQTYAGEYAGEPAYLPFDWHDAGSHSMALDYITDDDYHNFKTRPIPFRVAMLVRCVCDNLVISDKEARDFVLTGETPDTYPYSFTYHGGGKHGVAFYDMKIRGAKPSNDRLKAIAQRYRTIVPDEGNKRKRAPRGTTKLMVSFIDGLKAEGYQPGMGDMKWPKVLTLLTEKYPQCYYSTSETLHTSYTRACKRYGEQDATTGKSDIDSITP